jgi:N-acetylmuramoyl-L-alanine amidase
MGKRLFTAISADWRRAAGAAPLALALLAMALAAPSYGAQSADSVKLRFGGDQGQTRLVVESAGPVQGKLGAQDGRSLELSLSGVSPQDDLDGSGRGLVSAWSLKRTGSGAKLTLSLTRHAAVARRFLLPPADGIAVYRYVVDLTGDGSVAPPAARAPVKPAPAAPASTLAPSQKVGADHTLADIIQAAETFKARMTRKVIVIDAGHGGHDPGALGDRAQEKDITLAAAKMLRARLERTGRFKVVLTRDSDVFVPLEDRVQIARKANADLFISLHADVGADPSVHGATVYTLSDEGVDRAAKGVFDSGSFLNVKLPGRDQSVKQILLDLTQRNTRNRSGAFAETLIDQVGSQTDLVSRSHRDAGYVVLLAPDVPAVLLEMGFITNHKDEAQLMDPVRRGRLMNAVGQAIETYFADGADSGPKLAAR